MKLANTVTNETITEIAQAIAAASADKGYGYFGVRTADGTKIGKILEPSRIWIDGERTEDELPGACATVIRDEYMDGDDYTENAISKALETHRKLNYYGECTYIIGGDSIEYGEDPDEIIIHDAEVIAIISHNG